MGMKTNEENVNEGLILQLKGSMNEGDYGVFVALSHFTDHAKKFLEMTPRIRGIDCDEFISLFLKYYDVLDEKYRAAIPLQRVFIPNVVDNK